MTLVLWLGFVGAWLLFTGPVYQAALELREERFDEDENAELQAAASAIAPPPKDSAWWWLLPPVAYVRAMRRGHAWRQAVFHVLTASQRERFITFTNKATGWLIVAAGALLIAVKESAELVEHLEWPGWVMAPLLVVPAFLAVAFTASRMARTASMERESVGDEAPTAG